MSWRGLIRSFVIALVAAPALLHGGERPAASNPAFAQVLERFLSHDDSAPAYRALRRLEARNEQHALTAWMEVWTEDDGAGAFGYDVVAQGGSGLIRSKVFLASLEAEKKLARANSADRSALTPANYIFEPADVAGDLSALAVTPRREDVMLINGSIFVTPETGDLVASRAAVEGAVLLDSAGRRRALLQAHARRMPISLEAVAKVRMAGRNSFRMTYQYES